MGLQLPGRPATAPGLRRVLILGVLAIGVLALAGCSAESRGQWSRLAMPDPASAQGEHTLDLWRGAWIAALATGAVVWGLILYTVFRFRRKSDDEVPVQTRYNLPLEIFYTIAPIVMVIVFFSHTVRTQNIVLDETIPVDNTIEVVGQQWQWTFNYGLGAYDDSANDDASDANFAYDKYGYEVGNLSYVPTLILPVNETTRFNLWSPDVIHDFGVPGFLLKMDVIPGRVNHYAITPTRTGEFRGACYEFCGVYHNRMIFRVKVVTADEYAAYLQSLEAANKTSTTPLLGGADAYTQAGLDNASGSES